MTQIAPDLRQFARPIETVFEDVNNANEHDANSIRSIKDSLARFGQQTPLVANDEGIVIAHNGVLIAARELGWDQVAVVTFPNPELSRAYALADNRTGEFSEFDQQVVAATFLWLKEGGVPLDRLGWNAAEVNAFLKLAEKADGPLLSESGGGGEETEKKTTERGDDTFASTIEFASEPDQATFFAFLADLRDQFPEADFPGSKLAAWAKST